MRKEGEKQQLWNKRQEERKKGKKQKYERKRRLKHQKEKTRENKRANIESATEPNRGSQGHM